MADTTVDACVQCEKSDDHPKVHVLQVIKGELQLVSHHFDCLPHQWRKEHIEAAPHTASVFEKAAAGVRGDELRQHIIDVHAALPPVSAPYVTGPTAPVGAATTDTTQGV